MIVSSKALAGAVVLVSLLARASAVNQHLICKSVTDLFSEANDRHGSRGNWTGVHGTGAQGKPGKRGAVGPRGLPGIRGMKGDAGYVDYNNISEIVERKVCEGIRAIATGVNDVRTDIGNIQKSIEVLKCALSGVAYKGICYTTPHFSASQDLSHAKANETCQDRGFKLAEIHDRTQQLLLEEFIRSRMPSSVSYMYIWIGMTKHGDVLRYESGKEENVNHLVWWPGYPNSASSWRLILLGVKKSGGDGVWNYAETTANGVICENTINMPRH